MNPGRWDRELEVALAAVREAARLARDLQRRLGGAALYKPDASPVTVADFAVQALVAHRLRRAFPADPLVAEEDAAALRTPDGQSTLKSVIDVLCDVAPDFVQSHDPRLVLDAIDLGRSVPGSRFWTLDPIDGTLGFVRGGQYVVALALIVEGRVELGVLGGPELDLRGTTSAERGALLVAVRGHGTFRAPLTTDAFAPVHVSVRANPHDARVLRSFEGSHIDLETHDRILRALGVTAAPTLMDSQAKQAVIAAGDADLMIRTPATEDFHDKIWDHAAGTIVIEEAGGRVTDLRGAPLDFGAGTRLVRNRGLIASNGRLHDAVLAAFPPR